MVFATLPVRLRQCKYLNNVVEQDHRTVKKRTWLAKGYGSFSTAWRTLQGIEAVHMIRKGRVRWVAKGDAIATRQLYRSAIRHRRVTSHSVRRIQRLSARSTNFRNETGKTKAEPDSSLCLEVTATGGTTSMGQ